MVINSADILVSGCRFVLGPCRASRWRWWRPCSCCCLLPELSDLMENLFSLTAGQITWTSLGPIFDSFSTSHLGLAQFQQLPVCIQTWLFHRVCPTASPWSYLLNVWWRETDVVSLNLSAAFDMVEHATLLKRLSCSFGVSGVAYSWIRFYQCRLYQSLLDSSKIPKLHLVNTLLHNSQTL